MLSPSASSRGASSGRVRVRKADGTYALAEWAVVQQVGPASYAANGFQVDCSAFFSSIISAVGTRVFVTSSGVWQASKLPAQVNQGSGTDTFANAKFRAGLNGGVTSHAHNYDKTNTPTGNNNIDSPVGALAHTHGLTYTSTASSPASSSLLSERGVASDESTLTYEFLVLGIPI